jgi:hypothetical protein
MCLHPYRQGHYATIWKFAVPIPDEVIGFFNWPNSSSRTTALGSTQPLTEMSTMNLPGGKGRSARKADNHTAICEPIVYKMWEPRRLITLWASTACYRDSFTSVRHTNTALETAQEADTTPSASHCTLLKLDVTATFVKKIFWGLWVRSTKACTTLMPTQPPTMGAGCSFLEINVAGAWSWSLTLNLVPISRMVALYLHCSTCLHSVVLIWVTSSSTPLFCLRKSKETVTRNPSA